MYYKIPEGYSPIGDGDDWTQPPFEQKACIGEFDRDKTGSNITLRNNNLTFYKPTSARGMALADTGISSGKAYWEVTVKDVVWFMVGATYTQGTKQGYEFGDAPNIGRGIAYASDGSLYKCILNTKTPTDYGTGWSKGDIVGTALDMDNGTIEFFLNGASQGVVQTDMEGKLYPVVAGYRELTAAFDPSTFQYPPPEGFTSLCEAAGNGGNNSSCDYNGDGKVNMHDSFEYKKAMISEALKKVAEFNATCGFPAEPADCE